MLRIEHLTKRYDSLTAVNDLSLHIAPGEICGFIGHNGAGKTTTLTCAAGIQPFDSGEIYINAYSAARQPLDAKRQLAYLPDTPMIYEYMTGLQYLHFLADVFSMGKDLREDRIHEYASRFKLEEHLSEPASSYSHGMKQKLALVGAFMHEPRLIMMDEPFVGLDPLAAHTLKELMHAHCNAGGAIFFSTHVLEVAEKLCDRVAVIQNGRLICSGTMEEVRGDASLEDVFLELQEKKS